MMTQKELASLGVRLMAILALLLSVQALNDVFQGQRLPLSRYEVNVLGWWGAVARRGMGEILVGFGPFIIFLCLACVLWWGANGVVYFAVGRSPRAETVLIRGIAATEAWAVLLSAAGVFVSVNGILNLMSLLVTWASAATSPVAIIRFRYDSGSLELQTFSNALQLFLGLWLIATARRIAHRLNAT